MVELKALCVLSRMYGKKTMVGMLQEILARIPGVTPTYVFLDVDDYAAVPAPFWARLSDPCQMEWIIRRKAAEALRGNFDVLLVNAWEFVVVFGELARRIPAAAMMDAIPATFDLQLRQQGRGGWKRWLAHEVHHRLFARGVKHFDYFLPKGSDCRESLCWDYGIAPERCFVTLAPQPIEVWKPPVRTYSPPVRLLFAGNHFTLKGGDFLLRLYAEHLAGFCVLTIASNDPSVADRRLPEGVKWLRGINRDGMLDVYCGHDLFLHPTRQDFTPGVLGESLATGLPCLTTDIAGVQDLAIDGQTGFRIPLEAPASAWAEVIKRLAADPSELARLSRSARAFAEDKLGLERFERIIEDVIDRLRRGKFSRTKPSRQGEASSVPARKTGAPGFRRE